MKPGVYCFRVRMKKKNTRREMEGMVLGQEFYVYSSLLDTNQGVYPSCLCARLPKTLAPVRPW